MPNEFTEQEKCKMRELRYFIQQAIDRTPNAHLWVPIALDANEAAIIVKALAACGED